MAKAGKRLTRIYTRTGDQGRTRLVGGREVGKNDARIVAYGTVDELSSVLGVARAENRARPEGARGQEELERILRALQIELFVLGGDLATPLADRVAGMPVIEEAHGRRLEQAIDTLTENLGPLEEFILPCGGKIGAHLHLARTVCRRAERALVTLVEKEDLGRHVLAYVNRLSDYLFVLAREAARMTGDAEDLWER